MNPVSDFRKRRAEPDSVMHADEAGLSVDTRPTIRLGVAALVLGLGGFIAWASWAPLDEGVPVPATVVIDTKRKAIQHSGGGTVERVLVREGQHVRKGELLVEMNEAVTRASYESVRQNYMAQRAAESRLLAEMEGKPLIQFHADLLASAGDPYVRQHMISQSALFESRRNALQAELAGIDEAIAGQEATLSGLGLQLASRQRQSEKQAEQLRNLSELAAEGYVPRNQILQLEQAQAELSAVLADLQANKIRTQRSIAELATRKRMRTEDARKESSASLAEVRRQVQADHERLFAATGELKRVKIEAPVDGQVVGLVLSSVGGVISPGQKIMEIVPEGEDVVLEAKVFAHLIDRIKVGDHVDVRFNAFAHTPTLVVAGELHSVSADAITEPGGAVPVPYYLGRVRLADQARSALGDRKVQPGMQAEILIKTGERSLLTYLLNPLTRRISSSLKEE